MKKWCSIDKYVAIVETKCNTFCVEAYSFADVMLGVNECVGSDTVRSLVVTIEHVGQHVFEID